MKKYLPFAAIIVALSFNLIQASQKSGFEFEPLSMKAGCLQEATVCAHLSGRRRRVCRCDLGRRTCSV